jgi:hypothetical protein
MLASDDTVANQSILLLRRVGSQVAPKSILSLSGHLTASERMESLAPFYPAPSIKSKTPPFFPPSFMRLHREMPTDLLETV